jgi:hypothetical protein
MPTAHRERNELELLYDEVFMRAVENPSIPPGEAHKVALQAIYEKGATEHASRQ